MQAYVYQAGSYNNTENINPSPFSRLVTQSQKILLTVSSIFPFDLFPDKLVVDENKVRIIKKFFFFTERVTCILLENITDVEVSTSPFFATLKLRDASYYRFPRIFKINFLKIKDALEISKLIQGLIAIKKSLVDYSNMNIQTLREDLELLGDSDETKN